MKPAPSVLARATPRYTRALLVLALAAATLLSIWNWPTQKPPTPERMDVQQHQIEKPESASRRSTSELSTAGLKGDGIKIADWLKSIDSAAPDRVRLSSPDLPDSLPSLRMCDFDGDVSLPLEEALDLLRYAGIAVSPGQVSNSFEIRWADSQSWIEDELESRLTWGAFRSWQHMTIKIDSAWRAAISEAHDLKKIREISWAVRGQTLSVDIGDDGRVKLVRSDLPAAEDLDSALAVLISRVGDEKFASSTVSGLGSLVSLDVPPKSSPRSERAVAALIEGLASANLETRRLSVLALGQSNSIQALDALEGALGNSSCPPSLAAAILVAAKGYEKANRRFDSGVLGPEIWERRQAAYSRLRNWLSQPQLKDLKESTSEYAKAVLGAAESFNVDLALPHLKSLREQCSAPDSAISVAGPNWLHVSFKAEDALSMVRSEQPVQIRAALWRWNRSGADSPTLATEGYAQSELAGSIRTILQSAPSQTQRRLALEALFRPGDKRPGATTVLSDDVGLALNSFLRDSSPVVQRSASVIAGRLAGLTELQLLTAANLAARPPAGTDQLLMRLVQRCWSDPASSEESRIALGKLIDQLLESADKPVAERAAWAKMQNPGLDLNQKLRGAKEIQRASLRAIALKSIEIAKPPADVEPKSIDAFLHDNDPTVREAIFQTRLIPNVQRESDRAKLYLRGLKDPEAAVRLAVFKSPIVLSSSSRAAVVERANTLAEKDESQDVRAAASVWLATPIQSSFSEKTAQ